MAYTNFPVGLFTAGAILTAAQMNTYVRDNLTAVRSPQINVKQSFKTDVFTSSSTHTTFQDITGLSVQITPTFSDSKVLVIASLNLSNSVASATHMMVKLLRGSTVLGVPSSGSNPATAADSTAGNTFIAQLNICYLDSPATTSLTTYKIQGASTNNNAWYCNQRGDGATVQSSSITVMEIPV